MADGDEIQRRRALRRKRILDNSEDRLKKLTSSDRSIAKELEVISNGKLHRSNDRSSPSLDPPVAGVSRSPASALNHHQHHHHQQQQPVQQRVHGNYDTDSDDGSSYSQHDDGGSGSSRRVSDDSRNVQTLPKILTENKPCFKPKVDGTGRGSLTKSGGLLLPIHLVVWRKWLCVLLAILSRLLVQVISEGALYKLITVPVIALEVAILTFDILTSYESQQQPQGMMAAALLLCGIRNAVGLVYWYNTIVRVLQDLAVYFFVFFVCHQSIQAIV